MNRNDERFLEACAALGEVLEYPPKIVAELAHVGISGQAQAGVMSLGIPLSGMTEAERLDFFVDRAHQIADIARHLSDMFGAPVVDAAKAIVIAMRGEFDPIERYGISITVRDHRALSDRWNAIVEQSRWLA